MRRLGAAVGAVLMASCVETREVPVEATWTPSEETPAAVVRGAKVAVVERREQRPLLGPGAPGDAPAVTGAQRLPAGTAPPLPTEKRPGTTVEFTSLYRETYPSLSVLLGTVPQALKEAGFEPVSAVTSDEAVKLGADLVVELYPPEVEGFRRASGGGLSLEGTVYDVHVTSRAHLKRSNGDTLGHVSGHGQSVTNFRFEDPYLEIAVVGAVSLVVTVLATLAVGVPLAAALLYRANQGANEPVPLGLCNQAFLTRVEGVANRSGLCGKGTWIASQVGFMAVVAATAGVVLVFSRFVAARVFGGVTGLIKSLLAEGIWRDMLKASHDRAARSLAQRVALAWQKQRSLNTGGAAPAPAPGGTP